MYATAFENFPTMSAAHCVSCGIQAVAAPGMTCSRRCGWAANVCCPQCGRQRAGPQYTFCCGQCAGEARQANWCLGCGVRQLAHGLPSCGADYCAAVVASLPALRPQMAMSRGSSYAGPAGRRHAGNPHQNPVASARASRLFTPHVAVPLNDKTASAICNTFAQHVNTIVGVVKVGGTTASRKAYLAHRTRVETDLSETCGHGAPKYGHGGEGNEHRRYMPLRVECGTNALEFRGSCGSPSCEVCSLLANGMDLRGLDRASHFSTSTVDSALDCCPNGFAAVLVSRVVVGNPLIVDSVEHVQQPPAGFHSIVVCETERADSAFVFSDESVDPLYIVLVTRDNFQSA